MVHLRHLGLGWVFLSVVHSVFFLWLGQRVSLSFPDWRIQQVADFGCNFSDDAELSGLQLPLSSSLKKRETLSDRNVDQRFFVPCMRLPNTCVDSYLS